MATIMTSTVLVTWHVYIIIKGHEPYIFHHIFVISLKIFTEVI